ncbi:MAG: GNAT family N-acetyltransferase [Rhizobiaceae bacterium]|nr:GNAT family N-acetyltransferase [Rhizobiaceae bacterium]
MRPAPVEIRLARPEDLPAIVALFADDAIGGHGDTTDPGTMPRYEAAFERIASNPSDSLYVATVAGVVAGTFQTTLITTLNGRGATTMRIEAVQTRSDLRGQGIGATMITFAVARAREAGAATVHLTSNLRRTDAHRFYRRLGFVQSHAGFKLPLD